MNTKCIAKLLSGRKIIGLVMLTALLIYAGRYAWAGDCIKASELTKEASENLESGDNDGAVRNLRLARELCSESMSLRYNLGLSLYQGKKYNEAGQEFLGVIESNPKNAKALNAMALVSIKTGKYDDAIDYATKARKYDTNNKTYNDTLKLAFSYKNPPELSISAAVKSASLDGTIEAGEDSELKVTVINNGNSSAVITDIIPMILSGEAGFEIGKIEAGDKTVSPHSKMYFDIKIKTDHDKLTTGQVQIGISAREENDFEVKPFTITIKTKSSVDIPPSSAVKRPDAIAYVIGNKNYQHSAIPTVEYAENDAEVISKYLVQTLGFDANNVKLIKDADYMAFIKIFGKEDNYKGELYRKLKKGADVFIYYSGHGGPDTDSKSAYLVTSNTRMDNIAMEGYSMETLYNNLAKINEEKKAGNIIIVMDACFSGITGDGKMLIKNASPIYFEANMPQILKEGNTVLLTSSKGDQISSWYNEKRHGMFTYYLLKAIKDRAEDISNKKGLTIEELDSYLNENVNYSAQNIHNRVQEPVVRGNRNITLLNPH